VGKIKRLAVVVIILLMLGTGPQVLASGRHRSGVQEQQPPGNIGVERRAYDGQAPCLYSPFSMGCRDQSGAPVRAALKGTVIFAGADGDGPACGEYRGYGLGVVVDTGDGWQSLYAHLSEIHVSPGQKVTPDMVIGTVGETGCVSGPHLHFGLRHNEQLEDPVLY